MSRVLVIDDSALMRRRISQILAAKGHVTELARNGAHALDLLERFEPEVITLDIEMPEMDGLTFLRHLMEQRPTPVIMLSSLTVAGATVTLDALDLGAVDYVAKPDGSPGQTADRMAEILCQKIAAAAGSRLRRSPARTKPVAKLPVRTPSVGRMPSCPPRLLLIGASTGGPRTVEQLLKALPPDLPLPILLCQHMPASFTPTFARRLHDSTPHEVIEVTGPTPLLPGRVHVGRGDADLVVMRRAGKLMAAPVPSDTQRPWHPSVGRMVASVAQHVPPAETLGVMLTGMGDDGAAEMTELNAAGGFTIAEAEETCVVWGMPRALAERGGATEVLPADKIAAQLATWIRGPHRQSQAG